MERLSRCSTLLSGGCVPYRFLSLKEASFQSHKFASSQFLSRDIRDSFIKFYQSKHQHVVIPSSKVFIPEDNSLLFVNAGMNQFKPVLLGSETAPLKFGSIPRAVNSQKCIRAGGKHNDLEDVGNDLCHHTFFEMLGSWSFGDYFKKDACNMAWSLLTDIFQLSQDKLYVTYFNGCEKLGLKPDIETKEIWKSIGVKENRILPFGIKDNFWEMGDTGPCGPCTEIHYDQQSLSRYAPQEVNFAGSDIIEIWNLVFMQYHMVGNNILKPLNKCHVDTGMGLERITAVLQGKVSNYDTDLFRPIISSLEELSGCHPYYGHVCEEDVSGADAAYRVISDHIRMLTIAIGDGIYPGPRGRDLIVRQVLRRAAKVGTEKLGIPRMFLKGLVPVVVNSLKHAFPELLMRQSTIETIIEDAEKSFYEVLNLGDSIILKTLSKMSSSDKLFPADVAIDLLCYHGYPQDNLLSKVSQNGKFIRMTEIERFLSIKNSRKPRRDTRRKVLNKANVLHSLSKSNVMKTQTVLNVDIMQVTSDCDFFSPISTKVTSIIMDDTENTSNSTYLVLDKSCFFQPNIAKFGCVGYIMCQGKKYEISEVLNIEGWLLHRISSIEEDTPFPELELGEQVQIHATMDDWLPYLRAFTASCIVKLLLPLVCDKVFQKTKIEKDEVTIEIGGTIQMQNIKTFQKVINNLISKRDVISSMAPLSVISLTKELKKEGCALEPKDIDLIVTVKCKHQGTGRTIVHFLCGKQAQASSEKLKQLQNQVDSALELYKNLSSPDIVEIEELLQKVGHLAYDINQAKISVFHKSEYRNALSRVSSKLKTILRRLNHRV